MCENVTKKKKTEYIKSDGFSFGSVSVFRSYHISFN